MQWYKCEAMDQHLLLLVIKGGFGMMKGGVLSRPFVGIAGVFIPKGRDSR